MKTTTVRNAFQSETGSYVATVRGGQVVVWDSVAGHYTSCHSLSPRQVARVRRECAAVAAAATWHAMVAEDGHAITVEAASGLEAAIAFMNRGDWDGASPDATIQVYVWRGSRPELLSQCESYRCRCGDYQ